MYLKEVIEPHETMTKNVLPLFKRPSLKPVGTLIFYPRILARFMKERLRFLARHFLCALQLEIKEALHIGRESILDEQLKNINMSLSISYLLLS